MMAGNQVSKYNLDKGQEIIEKIIEVESKGGDASMHKAKAQ